MNTAVHPYTHVQVRRVTSYDFNDMLAIQKACGDAGDVCYPVAPTLSELTERFRDNRVIGLAAYDNSPRNILAFAVYQKRASYSQILLLAVHPSRRRRRIGSQLVQWISREIDGGQIKVKSVDLNTPGHLFLKFLGFSCVGVSRRGCQFLGEWRDTYEFAWKA